MTSINSDQESADFPLVETIDTEILMHRDAHFGGDFDAMLDYYVKGGPGVNENITIERIRHLEAQQKQLGKNLAPLMLSGTDAERVADAKTAYKKLRDLYDDDNLALAIPKLIADLVLSDQELPEAEIDAVVKAGPKAVRGLIELLRNDMSYDPLYPGYGLAPALAANCLGKIGDKSAIISLFEAIGHGDFFIEDMVLHALRQIGEPAKVFLLKVLHSRPVTYDNEKAAMALVQFRGDPDIVAECLKQLKDPHTMQHLSFATHLVLACEGATNPQQQQELIAIGKLPTTPKMLQQDIQTIAKTFPK
jgi:HEAT repeat protein